MYYLFSLAIAAVLGLIPANIAKNKGRSFGLWWFYGWMLFIVALIHALCLKDESTPQVNPAGSIPMPNTPPQIGTANPTQPSVNNPALIRNQYQISSMSAADELKKYKELLDQGVLTEDEFALKKEQLLKFI